MSETTLWWIDIETTGLNERVDQILEIALSSAAFDEPFNATERYHAIVRYREPVQSKVDQYVRDMHTKNGLWSACASSELSVPRAISEIIEIVQSTSSTDNILAGSSVHFDRRFLENASTRFAPLFSHQHYDVSAIKLFCESLGMPKIPKGEAHRAKADVLESIAHATQCAWWLRENGDFVANKLARMA